MELVLRLIYVYERKLVLLWQPLVCVPSPSRQDAKTPSVLDKAVTKALFMTAVEGSREQRAIYWEMFTHVLRLVVSAEHCTSGTQHGTSGGKGATEVRLAEVIIKKPPLFVRQWIVHSLTDTNIISFCLSRGVWTNSKYCNDTVLAFQNEVAGADVKTQRGTT